MECILKYIGVKAEKPHLYNNSLCIEFNLVLIFVKFDPANDQSWPEKLSSN